MKFYMEYDLWSMYLEISTLNVCNNVNGNWECDGKLIDWIVKGLPQSTCFAI